MKRFAKPKPKLKPKPSLPVDLVGQIEQTYQNAGVPLDPTRLERVKTLPEKKLSHLLNTLNELKQADKDELIAAADNVCQAFWNEQAIAAMRNRRQETDNQAGG